VRSLVHAWPCSARLQPLLPLPFPAPPLLVIFCAHLTFHHSLSCPISYFPPGFPYAFLTGLCPFWHIFCLDTGFEHLPLVCLPCWRYRWKRLILLFPKSPRTLQSDYFPILLHLTRAEYTNSSRARTDNRMNSVLQLYSIDLGVKNRFEWLSADSEGILISLIQKKRKKNPPLWATLAKSVRPPQTPDHWQKCETPDNACNAC
jgi:hypothetical protein